MASEPTVRRSSKSRTKDVISREPEKQEKKPARQVRTADPQRRFGRIQGTIRDTFSEIKKVTWPDKQTTRNLTVVVIAMAIVLGILLGGIDALFVRLWENIPI